MEFGRLSVPVSDSLRLAGLHGSNQKSNDFTTNLATNAVFIQGTEILISKKNCVAPFHKAFGRYQII